MSEQFKFAYIGGSGELTEKKSRFIATVEPVRSEDEAQVFLERMKKQYWDATHNCTAFTIGSHHELTRCSDDGEPAGTAGRPMLEVLLGEDIHDVAVVVTRYFGGTLLGTGGLVRAYSRSVREGLKNSVILEKILAARLLIQTDYKEIGKAQYLLAQNQITVLDTQYTDVVTAKTLVPLQILETVKTALTEGTGGRALLHQEGCCWYALHGKEILIFEEDTK